MKLVDKLSKIFLESRRNIDESNLARIERECEESRRIAGELCLSIPKLLETSCRNGYNYIHLAYADYDVSHSNVFDEVLQQYCNKEGLTFAREGGRSIYGVYIKLPN